jgi:hypothetical protein
VRFEIVRAMSSFLSLRPTCTPHIFSPTWPSRLLAHRTYSLLHGPPTYLHTAHILSCMALPPTCTPHILLSYMALPSTCTPHILLSYMALPPTCTPHILLSYMALPSTCTPHIFSPTWPSRLPAHRTTDSRP